MKMLFFAYIFTSLLEFLFYRKNINNIETFVYGRLFSAVAYPWLTITIWFVYEALTNSMLPMPWEIIYANVMTVLGIYIALRMEELFVRQILRPAFKGIILLLFLAALISYVGFTFNTPVYFFSTPPLE